MYIIYTSNVFAVTCSFDSKRDIGHCNWQRIGKCYCNSNQLINFYWRIQKPNNKKLMAFSTVKKSVRNCTVWFSLIYKNHVGCGLLTCGKSYIYTLRLIRSISYLYRYMWYAHKGNIMNSSETCRYTLWTLTSIYSCVS